MLKVNHNIKMHFKLVAVGVIAGVAMGILTFTILSNKISDSDIQPEITQTNKIMTVAVNIFTSFWFVFFTMTLGGIFLLRHVSIKKIE